MKKQFSFFIVLLLAAIWAPYLQAQTPPPQTKSSVSSPSNETNDQEKPFKPYYENEFELGTTNQQGGQSSGFFSYTGTFYLNEAGHFLAAGVQTSRQKVEGIVSNTGSLILGGGLGLGFFSPALTVNLGGGEQGWRQISGDLTLGFQLWDPLSLEFSFGGSAGSHQGPASDLLPNLTGLALIDTNNADSSLGFTFIPWDWWSISTTLEYQSDGSSITYRNVNYALNKSDQIANLTLGLDFTLFKGFILDIDPQVGREYYPAGISYSVETGGLVHNSSASSKSFLGSTVSVGYSFE